MSDPDHEPTPGPNDPDRPKAPPSRPVMDRRGPDRRKGERRKAEKPVDVERRSGEDRRKGDRRTRNINQYDLSEDELEFIQAVNRFREGTGNRFPTAKDILQILRDLGYEKRSS